MNDRSEANEETDPGSFSGMRKSIARSNETAEKALAWSLKTHDLVTKIHSRVSREETVKNMSTVLISVGVSLLTSAVVVACSLAGR